MIKSPSEMQTIQRHFKDVNMMLMNVVDGLSRSGNPIVSSAPYRSEVIGSPHPHEVPQQPAFSWPVLARVAASPYFF